jgi:hypothetical protein
MKNIFLLLLFSLNISCSQKQSNYKGFGVVTHNSSITDLQGKWRISELITSDETKEYSLYPKNPDGYNYGNNISLNADQTFVSGYSAPCGNDCFTTTMGKYKIIDKNYICFYLEKINRSGDCSGNSQPHEDLGLYYYYKKEKNFHLLKSSGNLEQDKKNVCYRDLITLKRQEIEKFYKNWSGANYFMFNWKRTDLTDEKEIVAFCMAANQIKNYEILYSDKGGKYSSQLIILVKVEGEFRYVIYDTWGKPMVCLYEDSKVMQIDKLINEIDRDKSLESKSFKEKNISEESSSDKKTITVFKKRNEIYKVIYQKYPEDVKHTAVSTTTIYFQNSIPVYIESQYAFVENENDGIDKKGLYVLDWESNKEAIKIISSGGMYASIKWIKPEINRIMDEIKKQNL